MSDAELKVADQLMAAAFSDLISRRHEPTSEFARVEVQRVRDYRVPSGGARRDAAGGWLGSRQLSQRRTANSRCGAFAEKPGAS